MRAGGGYNFTKELLAGLLCHHLELGGDADYVLPAPLDVSDEHTLGVGDSIQHLGSDGLSYPVPLCAAGYVDEFAQGGGLDG